MSHVQANHNMVRADFTGDVNELLKLLAGYKVENFTLQDADLESTFMQYYEERPHA
jgi:hypothetical protein